MSKRPTIRDVAKRAGVSVATVDRVLNARHTVRATTAERVLHAAEALNYHATALLKHRIEETAPRMTLGFLLQKSSKHFYRQLAADLEVATHSNPRIRGEPLVHFVDELAPAVIAEHMRELGHRANVLAVVAVDHPQVASEIATLREHGVPCFAILSDLTAPAKAGFVGIDSRKAGRTAAWAIARLAQAPGEVGILIGSHRYLSQEDREIGFRSYLREHYAEFRVLEPIVYLDDAAVGYDAALDLFKKNPHIVGLYVCGGGIEGALSAVREEKLAQRIVFACNELTPSSRAGLIEGAIDIVIATPTCDLAQQTVTAMVAAAQRQSDSVPHISVPFEIYVSENV